jgi:hypothetical protein
MCHPPKDGQQVQAAVLEERSHDLIFQLSQDWDGKKKEDQVIIPKEHLEQLGERRASPDGGPVPSLYRRGHPAAHSPHALALVHKPGNRRVAA